MNSQLRAMMNDTEQALLREVESGNLSGLDEDALVELHTRVRRARNKYSKLYRRRASAQVGQDASRAKASSAHTKTARKAEIFEDALARVSRQLARAAKASADGLKAERLAAARSAKAPKVATKKGATSKKTALPAEKRKRRTGVSKRGSAQARAANRRGQAKRAARA